MNFQHPPKVNKLAQYSWICKLPTSRLRKEAESRAHIIEKIFLHILM